MQSDDVATEIEEDWFFWLNGCPGTFRPFEGAPSAASGLLEASGLSFCCRVFGTVKVSAELGRR